jgi:hypothetical protein
MATSDEQMLSFDKLGADQRQVAWAVVRSLATAAWVMVVAVVPAATFVVAHQAKPYWLALPLAGALALAAGLELQARGLEKPHS